MTILLYMLAGAMALAVLGLAAFVWSLRSGQFEDPAGAAVRALNDEERPIARLTDSARKGD